MWDKTQHDTEMSSSEVSSLIMQQKSQHLTNKLLEIHQKFAHMPFARLQEMAKQGIMPKSLAACPVPACLACMCGKATRKRWRHKTPKNMKEPIKTSRPGQVISVDMLDSPSPGFVAQLTGKLTVRRHKCAIVYVENFSGLSYMYNQTSSSAEHTLKGKLAFELCAEKHGVRIERYHADNGIFRANLWVQDCMNKSQQFTFAAVGAHHQNGQAERRIRLL